MNSIEEKIKFYKSKGFDVPQRKLIKTHQQIEGIRESGKRNTALLDYIEPFIIEGISTEEINQLIHNETLALGGIPAPLNYNGFPKSICVSINEVACHGIPSKKELLKSGDIVNIDVSTLYKGYFSDSSRMFCVGEVSKEKQRLVAVAKESMNLGIEQVKPWGFLGDIGHAIKQHACKNGYTVVPDIGGHGIGIDFHEEPWVDHISKRGTGILLVPGLVFTVEPILNLGSSRTLTDSLDGWTIRTADGKPSAQWEKMILVTESGFEVLAY